MSLLIKLLRGRKLWVALAVLTSGLSAAVSFLWNAQLGGIINGVSAGVTPGTAVLISALGTAVTMGLFNFLKTYLSGYACESMTHGLRTGYARHFLRMPAAEAEKLNAGEQISKLQNEIASVSNYMNGNLFQLLDDAVNFFATFAWLFWLNPVLAVVPNLPVLVLTAYIFWSSKVIGAAVTLSQQAKGRMNRYADNLLTLFPVIKLYGAEKLTIDGYIGEKESWERETVRAERIRARLMSLSAMMSAVPLALLFLVGGGMVINGAMRVGTLYIFLNLSANVSGVLKNMPAYIAAFRQFLANAERINIIYPHP